MLNSGSNKVLRITILSEENDCAKIWFQSRSENWEFLKRYLPDVAFIISESEIKFQPLEIEVKKEWLLSLTGITIV